MATANYINKSIDNLPQYEFYINHNQMEFYPDGIKKMMTKIGLLWRSCSEDTFYRLHGRVPRGLETSCQLFVCLDFPQAAVACMPSVDLKQLTAVQKNLLFPVPFSERLYCLEKSLRIGQACGVGDCVLAVDPQKHELREPTKFDVRFKGNLRERRDTGTPYAGTYFGLVSTEPIKNYEPRQISCFDNVYSPDVSQYVIRERNEGDHQAVLCHLEWIVGLVDKKFSLKSGDQVLWFDDERPFPLRGVVVRIVSDKLASVNFDVDGKKKQLDVPIEALMLASEYEVETASAAEADKSGSLSASGHVPQGGDGGTASPSKQPIDPVALAAEHGLELNASVLVDEPQNHLPQRGFLRWCGRYRDEPIAAVDCETQPFDTLSPTAIWRVCPTAPMDRNVAFVHLNRVRIDPRFCEARPAASKLSIRQSFEHEAAEIVEADCMRVLEKDMEEVCRTSLGAQASALSVENPIATFMSTEHADRLDSNFTAWNIILRKNGKKKCIGEGSFGKVYKALTNCHQTIAVKIVKLRGVKDVSQLEKAIERERQGIEMLKAVRHPNIIVFLKSEYTTDNQFCIFTELIAGSSLAKLMMLQRKPFDEAGVKKFSIQICSALNFLHLRKPAILHRDINCNNIMLTNEGIIKLIDFGLAKEIISVTAYDTAHTCGTQHFMAPELFSLEANAIYSPKSDVWAFGCTVFEMIEMQPPNGNLRREQIPMAVLTRDMPQMTGSVSASLTDFYNSCVVKDRKLRPDTSELLRHGFLTGSSE